MTDDADDEEVREALWRTTRAVGIAARLVRVDARGKCRNCGQPIYCGGAPVGGRVCRYAAGRSDFAPVWRHEATRWAACHPEIPWTLGDPPEPMAEPMRGRPGDRPESAESAERVA